MIVTCPNCDTRYNLPDDKIPPGGAKVKCSKCAHVFKAELPPATPEEEVVDLLEEESTAADTKAGDDFDETFDEVAAGDTAADEPPVPEEEPAGDDDMADLDDLFSDDDAGEAEAPADDDQATADDVEALFGDDADDDGGLFDDDDAGDAGDSGDAGDDLFADDDDSGGDDDLFADDDDSGDDSGGDDDLFAGGDDDDDIFAGGDDDDDDEDDDDEYEDDEDDEYEDEPQRSRKPLGCLIILLVLGLIFGAAVYLKAWTWVGLDLGTYFQNVPYVGKLFMEETGGEKEAAPGESPADRVRKIELKNVKQYYVANEKTGNLFVVEGKAVNKFFGPKERIKVEVVLYDGAGGVLTSQSFLCGNVLSQFQLQVQTQAEIEEGLGSEVGILSNNTFIRPGASTPFMAVFFAPPAGVKEFLVKVVDVGDPE